MATDHHAGEIVEQFTFRANRREHTINGAIIDPAAQQTRISQAVVDALGLESIRETTVGPGGSSAVRADVCRCVVAWTIYESQGYCSLLDVVSIPGSGETVVGSDFLAPHQLTVDVRHRGLVGVAPPNAEPVTGGGYVIGATREQLRQLNRARVEAAKPGVVLRPYPAWRFTHPTGFRRASSPPGAGDPGGEQPLHSEARRAAVAEDSGIS